MVACFFLLGGDFLLCLEFSIGIHPDRYIMSKGHIASRSTKKHASGNSDII